MYFSILFTFKSMHAYLFFYINIKYLKELTSRTVLHYQQLKTCILLQVFIAVVDPPSCDDLFLSSGIIYREVQENEGNNTEIALIQTESGTAENYCIVSVTPSSYESEFSFNCICFVAS